MSKATDSRKPLQKTLWPAGMAVRKPAPSGVRPRRDMTGVRCCRHEIMRQEAVKIARAVGPGNHRFTVREWQTMKHTDLR